MLLWRGAFLCTKRFDRRPVRSYGNENRSERYLLMVTLLPDSQSRGIRAQIKHAILPGLCLQQLVVGKGDLPRSSR